MKVISTRRGRVTTLNIPKSYSSPAHERPCCIPSTDCGTVRDYRHQIYEKHAGCHESDEAYGVGILDTKNPAATSFPRKSVIEQRRTQTSKMKRPGWRGRKA